MWPGSFWKARPLWALRLIPATPPLPPSLPVAASASTREPPVLSGLRAIVGNVLCGLQMRGRGGSLAQTSRATRPARSSPSRESLSVTESAFSVVYHWFLCRWSVPPPLHS